MIEPERHTRANKNINFNYFYNFKNLIQTKWQGLINSKNKTNLSSSITNSTITVFPIKKQTILNPSKINEKNKGNVLIKSILKKPKISSPIKEMYNQQNNNFKQRETNNNIPLWKWNTQLEEKSPYEKIIEDRVEREENCIQGRLVAVERLMRTTTTTKANNNQQNIYWPGTGLARTFI